MRVNLRIDPARLILRLRPLTGARGLAFAAVNAINAAALKVQEAAFENVRRRFVVRRPAFLFGTAGRPGGAAARITPRASVGAKRPFADVSVQGGLGRGSFRRRTLLAEFERGAIRRGDPFLAVPIVGGPARPTFPSQVPAGFTLAGLALAQFKGKRAVLRLGRGRKKRRVGLFDSAGQLRLRRIGVAGDEVQIKGRRRTFVIRPQTSTSYPAGGVFRRTGPERGAVELVYAFRKQVPLDARLGFVPLAVSTANRWLPEFLERETIREIARADRASGR